MTTLGTVSTDILAKIESDHRTISITKRSHYIASERTGRANNFLGISVIVITAITGSSIFATLQENPDLFAKIVVGLLSWLAAVLAALQTFFGFTERSSKHKDAAAKYAAIQRSLGLLILELKSAGDETAAIAELRKIAERRNELAAESRSVPDSAYDKAIKEADKEQAKV